MNIDLLSYEEKAELLKKNSLNEEILFKIFNDPNPQIKKFVIENKGMTYGLLEKLVLRTKEEQVLISIAESLKMTVKTFKSLLNTNNKEVLLSLSLRKGIKAELRIEIGEVFLKLVENHMIYNNDPELISHYSQILTNIVNDENVSWLESGKLVDKYTSIIKGTDEPKRKKFF